MVNFRIRMDWNSWNSGSSEIYFSAFLSRLNAGVYSPLTLNCSISGRACSLAHFIFALWLKYRTPKTRSSNPIARTGIERAGLLNNLVGLDERF